jgi:hypothetical protein
MFHGISGSSSDVSGGLILSRADHFVLPFSTYLQLQFGTRALRQGTTTPRRGWLGPDVEIYQNRGGSVSATKAPRAMHHLKRQAVVVAGDCFRRFHS